MFWNSQNSSGDAMPGRFLGRFWHALKRCVGPEIVGLIAQFLSGPGILLHWDFLTETPLRDLLPELAARGIPEHEWPSDRNPDGSSFYPGHFNDGYGYCRAGCDTSSDSDGESFYTGPRAPSYARLAQRRRLHSGWRFGFHQLQRPALLDRPAPTSCPAH